MATININLKKNFTTQYNKMQTEYGEEFAKLNGFADSQLSYTDFIDNFIDSATVADASVDGNANVSNKDMRTLMNEMPKSHRKLLCFNKIYYELNKKYGFKTANDWLRAEWTKALYMHDSDTATYIHYCFAYDLKDVAEKGLFFIDNFKYRFTLFKCSLCNTRKVMTIKSNILTILTRVLFLLTSLFKISNVSKCFVMCEYFWDIK